MDPTSVGAGSDGPPSLARMLWYMCEGLNLYVRKSGFVLGVTSKSACSCGACAKFSRRMRKVALIRGAGPRSRRSSRI